MPLLYYWRPDNYTRDRAFGFGYHLNQNSPAMAAARPGDSLWAFTRRPRDGLYVLAAELVVRALTRNPPRYRYGAYRLWGDLEKSRYFDAEAGANAEPLLRRLGVPAHTPRLGQSFQGHAAVRVISEADHRLLAALSANRPVAERAGIYPEDELDVRLVHGDEAQPFVIGGGRPEHARRLEYLYHTVDVRRARRHVAHLQELYGGCCQLCLYDPAARYGHHVCHGHHIQWLSRGGEDEPENLVLLCPNHHAAVHCDDAPFDYAGLAFTFSRGPGERVRLNRHLPSAA